jgi:nucleotide-binding universal stress UspA family protein
MLSIRSILHPTDFSPRADYAFQLACLLAKEHGARLLALHVAPPPPPSVIAIHGAGVSPEQSEVQRESLWNTLRQLQAPDASVSVEHRLEVGDAAAEIVRVAQEAKCDLVVMGTQGRTGLTRLLMGSVAEQVLRRASCPVLTVKYPLPASSLESGQPAAESGQTT